MPNWNVGALGHGQPAHGQVVLLVHLSSWLIFSKQSRRSQHPYSCYKRLLPKKKTHSLPLYYVHKLFLQVTASNWRIYKILSKLMLFSNFSFKKILKHNKHVAKSHQNKPINQFRSNSTDTSISLVHPEGSRNRCPNSQRHQENHKRGGRRPHTSHARSTWLCYGTATWASHWLEDHMHVEHYHGGRLRRPRVQQLRRPTNLCMC